jgi:hypothetical protein
MRVTIHQPNYLPWLGFFEKVSTADTYVILDSVQYEKGGFTNRNKVRTPDSPAGWQWLTVPVKKGSSNMLIRDVEIDNTQKWREISLRTVLRAYQKAPFLNDYRWLLEEAYKKEWGSLRELNVHMIEELFKAFSLSPRIVCSSELDIAGKKSDLNLDICKQVGATTYVSGISGKGYLDMASFKEAGIDVEIQDYQHPIYKQVSEPFIANMCALDVLLNYGPESMKVIACKK